MADAIPQADGDCGDALPRWTSAVVDSPDAVFTLEKLQALFEMLRRSEWRPPSYTRAELRVMGYDV